MSGQARKTHVSLSLFRPFLLAARLGAWQTSYEAGSKAEPNFENSFVNHLSVKLISSIKIIIIIIIIGLSDHNDLQLAYYKL